MSKLDVGLPGATFAAGYHTTTRRPSASAMTSSPASYGPASAYTARLSGPAELVVDDRSAAFGVSSLHAATTATSSARPAAAARRRAEREVLADAARVTAMDDERRRADRPADGAGDGRPSPMSLGSSPNFVT